jgi:hypothetical protein
MLCPSAVQKGNAFAFYKRRRLFAIPHLQLHYRVVEASAAAPTRAQSLAKWSVADLASHRRKMRQSCRQTLEPADYVGISFVY